MKEYIVSKEHKQIYVNRMFSKIAPRYDLVTHLLSFGMDHRWKQNLAGIIDVQPHNFILDLACGTGDITFLLAEKLRDGTAIGVDITPGMIELACKKKNEKRAQCVEFRVGDITQLNMKDRSFDVITVGYGVRNVPDIPHLLQEVYRLLKPGGRFFTLDFGKPSNRVYRAMYMSYLWGAGSFLGWLLHRDADVYGYISESIKHYPGQTGVNELLRTAGFVDTRVVNILGGALAINIGSKPS